MSYSNEIQQDINEFNRLRELKYSLKDEDKNLNESINRIFKDLINKGVNIKDINIFHPCPSCNIRMQKSIVKNYSKATINKIIEYKNIVEQYNTLKSLDNTRLNSYLYNSMYNIHNELKLLNVSEEDIFCFNSIKGIFIPHCNECIEFHKLN